MGNICMHICKGHLLFENTLRSAFQYFLNRFNNSPIYLAIYTDNDLKKSFFLIKILLNFIFFNLQALKLLSEEEVDKKINSLITIFSYLNERDIFFQHYEKYFAKRLLNLTSTSLDYENKMLSRLKVFLKYFFFLECILFFFFFENSSNGQKIKLKFNVFLQ